MVRNVQLTAAALALAVALPAFAKPITAVVRLKEKMSIENLAYNVQNPGSERFGKAYTPDEIRSLAGPSDVDYQQTLSALKAEGFTILAESPTHLWISVKGDSSLFESTFSTQIANTSKGTRFALSEAAVPTRLGTIAAVHGLDNRRHAFPKFVKASAPLDDTASHGGVTPETIKSAYGFNPIYSSGLSGKGQHIAIATYDGFHIADVQAFYQLINLSPVPAVDQVQFNGNPAVNDNSAMETELDAEFSGMIAPGASIHVFASNENSDAGELAMFTAILDDNRAKIVNYSWGSCESSLTPAHQAEMAKVFARAVAQGVNVMVASGDSGSDSCQNNTTAADWPAANPNVVAVGGTTFAQDHGSLSETGWAGSGGGISALWDLPDWQKAIGGIYVKRSYPDVSFNADPSSGQAVYVTYNGSPTWLTIGGTSMAAPQWSGFMALVGEARANAGKTALGFLPPIIYALTPDEKSTMFHDVTSGNNGTYSCSAGWDAVTGWGSLQASPLLTRLQSN